MAVDPWAFYTWNMFLCMCKPKKDGKSTTEKNHGENVKDFTKKIKS